MVTGTAVVGHSSSDCTGCEPIDNEYGSILVYVSSASSPPRVQESKATPRCGKGTPRLCNLGTAPLAATWVSTRVLVGSRQWSWFISRTRDRDRSSKGESRGSIWGRRSLRKCGRAPQRPALMARSISDRYVPELKSRAISFNVIYRRKCKDRKCPWPSVRASVALSFTSGEKSKTSLEIIVRWNIFLTAECNWQAGFTHHPTAECECKCTASWQSIQTPDAATLSSLFVTPHREP
ncbi:hypothetical protein J6590_038795 [Homalodisca vitripennis]|nr:hypothetical protein J6590_038795 [Homalodisca vitripennis]